MYKLSAFSIQRNKKRVNTVRTLRPYPAAVFIYDTLCNRQAESVALGVCPRFIDTVKTLEDIFAVVF